MLTDVVYAPPKSLKPVATAKGGTTVFYSEDFSNGFAGQGANGAWEVGGPQGNLWFRTFPIGAPNGYNPNAPLPVEQQAVYGLFLPNYFGTQTTIASPTASNGFMMMDADRWNSTKLNPSDPAAANTTSNTITSYLISPVIDLSAALGQAAVLTFSQKWRMCCNDYKLAVEVSLDGGNSWITGAELDIFVQNNGAGNTVVENTAVMSLTNITTNATTLSNFRLRFVWDDAGLVPPNPNTGAANNPSHYYFMIDDIAIQAAPSNELVMGATYINNYHEIPDEAADVVYVNAFEYWNSPTYLKRPFNFAAEVRNEGSQTQTGVVLTVEVQAPNQAIQLFTTDPISLAPGEETLLSINNVNPTAWTNNLVGTYTVRFSVSQNETDNFPENNVGMPRTTRLNNEATGAIFQNDRNVFSTLYPTLGQDVIYANRFAYSQSDAQNVAITHVEYVLSGSTNGPTQPGEVFYINVRSGSVFEPQGPNNVMTRYFGDDELEVTTLAGTFSAGGTLNWLSYTLPTPIFIEPNKIYQGEIDIPAAGGNIVIPACSNQQEIGSGALYNFNQISSGPQGWFSLGENSVMIRFRTNIISSVPEISVEQGIRMTQNYPNPFVDATTIQFQPLETGDVRFEVHDIQGRLVHAENLGVSAGMSANVHRFERGNLQSGVYTYSIITGGNRVTRKMVID